jgi:UDP-N-acetyl-D-mannosaminuronic acid dehydrogenase
MKSNNNLKETVSVIGLGRVGLPLALVLADKGFKVYGIGRDQAKMEGINKGTMPFMEKGASKILKKTIGRNFIATTDYSVVSKSNYIILTLGTPIDENMNPVYDQINSSVNSIKKFLKPNQTLILRSTVSPETTRYVKSIIDSETKLTVGKNFYLAFCPERIAEGKAIEEISTIPQLIGGVDPKSSKNAELLFKSIGVKTLISDDVSVELAKLFTNMYRYINLAIGNEFWVLSENYKRDIHEIINLVNFGYNRGGINSPGLTAGPCLFKDGFFLISDLPFGDLISTSWKINEAIPLLLVKKIKEVTNLEDKKVTILGVAFKAEIDDIRESLSFKARKAFLRERTHIVIHDPYVKKYINQEIETDVYNAITGADIIFIATNHMEYSRLNISKLKKLANKNCLISDIWNVFGTNKTLFALKDISQLKKFNYNKRKT